MPCRFKSVLSICFWFLLLEWWVVDSSSVVQRTNVGQPQTLRCGVVSAIIAWCFLLQPRELSGVVVGDEYEPRSNRFVYELLLKANSHWLIHRFPRYRSVG